MKKTILVALALAGVVCFGKKEREKREFPVQSRQRILQIAAALPEKPCLPGPEIGDRKIWEKLGEQEVAARIIASVEKLLERKIEEIPDDLYLECAKTGNRTNYQLPFFRRGSELNRLATAEMLENKGRFLKKIAEYMETMAKEKSWTLPSHDVQYDFCSFYGKEHYIDLGVSSRAISLAWTMAKLGDKLPSETKEMVRAAMEKFVFEPHRRLRKETKRFDKQWWFRTENNWSAVCHCGSVLSALAMIEDRNERAEVVEAAERMKDYYFDGFTDDGYCSEGMGYWDYGWGHFMTMALTVRGATNGKVDFLADPKTKVIMQFGTGAQLAPNKAPAFSDGGGHVADYVLRLGYMAWPDIPLTESAMKCETLHFAPAEFSLMGDGIVKSEMKDLPLRNSYPIGQVWVMRTDGKDGKPFTVGVKCGHNNEFHNHNDVGSFELYENDIHLTGEPGGTEYVLKTFSSERYTIPIIASFAHPVPVINKFCQHEGREFFGKVLTNDFSEAKDTIAIDIAKAYPKKANVRNAIRTFVFDRAEKIFTVTDDITFKQRGTFVVPIVTPGMLVETDVKGRYHMTVNEGDKLAECDVEISSKGAQWKLAEGKRVDNPHRTAPMRYPIVLTGGPVANAAITVKFIADRTVVKAAIEAEKGPHDALDDEREEITGEALFDEESGVKPVIVTPKGWCWERVYAREIRQILGEMTEANCEIVSEVPAKGPAIILKAEGEASVKTKGDRAYLSGEGTKLGVAVSHFLEQLGVRYLAPGEENRVIPGESTVVLPCMDWQGIVNRFQAAPEKKQLYAMLKGSAKIRDFYEWHNLDSAEFKTEGKDGWDIYREVKRVTKADRTAYDALLADYRRAAFGPAARVMGEYYRTKEKTPDDTDALRKILEKAKIEAVHDPAASDRIRDMIDEME